MATIKSKKRRKFEIVEYDLANVPNIIAQIKAFYDEGRVKNYAYAKHDKDVYQRELDNPDEMPEGKKFGDPKRTHYHLGFVWYTPVTFSNIAKKFNIAETCITNIKSNRFGDYLAYLTHRNRPQKYQYDDEIVHTNIVDWQKSRDSAISAKKVRDLEADFSYYFEKATAGELTYADIGEQLPTLLYANHAAKFDSAFQIAQTLKAKKMNFDQAVKKTIVFITGKSGSGKTTYAKGMAAKAGLNYFVSSSSNDPLDGYKGESCLIMDDARGQNFTYEDLLKLIDPHTVSSYNSRYNNKLVTAELIIITSVQSLKDFIRCIPNANNEDSTQIKRRISMSLQITTNKIQSYLYDAKTNDFIADKTLPNRINKFIKEKDTIRPDKLLW